MGDLTCFTPGSMGEISGLWAAVSTRHGGVSPAPFHALNLGASVGDEPANVEENLTRLHQALGLDRSGTVDARQAQGGNVGLVTESERGTRVSEVDALITDRPGVSLMLRFADCVPVLFYDPVHRAIGIAHAGWRGTVAKVAANTVGAMADTFGSEASSLLAFLGPSIGPCCYQVGSEVCGQVEGAFPKPGDLILRRNGSTYLDLWAANVRLLREAGVDKIEVAAMCTADNSSDFYSWRGEHARTGRFAAMIGLSK